MRSGVPKSALNRVKLIADKAPSEAICPNKLPDGEMSPTHGLLDCIVSHSYQKLA